METFPYHTYCVTTIPGRSEAPPFSILIVPPNQHPHKNSVFVNRELAEAQRYVTLHTPGGTDAPEKTAAGLDS